MNRADAGRTHETPPSGTSAGASSRDVILDVRDLAVAFGHGKHEAHAVRGVSFQVRAGRRLGLVGESGSGKSLTALSVMRLVPKPGRITAGEVLLDGTDLLRLEPGEMAKVRGGRIGMVYQDPLSALNPVRTVGHQIVEAIRIHLPVSRREARARTIELLGDVGVPDPSRRIDSYPHELSGGMRQRVVIAMAMCADPVLLIADEPTSALDVTTQALIIELIARLGEERGTAVILITHDLAVAAEFCAEIEVMYAGRIVERGPTERLFSRPIHPYSEALLDSILLIDSEIAGPIPGIPGQPPLLQRLPPGCAFHPRCSHVRDVCRTTEPEPHVLLGPNSGMAECHLAHERLAGGVTSPSGGRSSQPDAAEPVPNRGASGAPLLVVEHLGKDFRSSGWRAGQAVRAVDDVSFTIGQGETFGLVGESGSGKSTVARLCLRLLEPTSGRIEFDGREITTVSASEMRPLRREMQIVFQDPFASLNRRKTVEEIISAPLAIHGERSAARRHAQVDELLDLVGLSPQYGRRYPHEMSGGQCQRVSIARALALGPKLVVLDEAVSSLDVSVRSQILNLLRELQDRLRLTYLFISHDLSVIRYMATTVGVMQGGRIVETGPVRDVFENPRHSYTQQLKAAVPMPELVRKRLALVHS